MAVSLLLGFRQIPTCSNKYVMLCLENDNLGHG